MAERFPSAKPAWWLWPIALVRGNLLPIGTLAGLAAVVVLVVSLGVSTNGSSDDSASSVSVPASGKAESAAGSTAVAPAATPGAVSPQPRDVIRNVSLTLSTTPAAVEDVSDRAIRVADTLGGYVQDSSITARQSAEITLRVPQDKLQQALTQLSRLAHVRSRTQEAQDVTDQAASLDAAVRDARAYRDSLRSRLARAKTDREASSLRGRLQAAEQRLRSRQRQVAQLSQQTSLATIDVSVRGDRSSGAAAKPAGDRWTPGDALHDAGRVLEVVAGVALIALAIALPIAVVVVIALLLGRIVTRRRRERALELA